MRSFQFLALMLPLLVGCSLGSPPNRVVRIALPTHSSPTHSSMDPLQKILSLSDADFSTAHTSAESFTPTSLNDFDCFALNVRGPEIERDSRLTCSNADGYDDYLGRFVGFVSKEEGSIEIEVPAGPARQIQLVGIHSHLGCASIDDLLNGYQNDYKVDPYELATKTIDIFEDKIIELKATFDSEHPRRAFRDCKGPYDNNNGGINYKEVRLASAYKGYFEVTPGSGESLFHPFFKTTDLAEDLSNTITEFTATELSNLGQVSGFTYSKLGISDSSGARAMMQFKWAINDSDLINYPYAKFEIYLQGGVTPDINGSCPSGSEEDNLMRRPTVRSAVLYNNNNLKFWLPLGRYLQTSDSSTWGWGGGSPGVPVSQLLTAKNGQQYVVMNVESNYVSLNSRKCKSATVVRAVKMLLMSSQYEPTTDTPPLSIRSIAEHGTHETWNSDNTQRIAENVFVIKVSDTTVFKVTGGTPPYSFTSSNAENAGNAANGTFTQIAQDAKSGYFHYTAPVAMGISKPPLPDVLTVTDSSGDPIKGTIRAKIFTYSVPAPGAAGKPFGLKLVHNDLVSFTIDNCISFIVYLTSFNQIDQIASSTPESNNVNVGLYSNTSGELYKPTINDGCVCSATDQLTQAVVTIAPENARAEFCYKPKNSPTTAGDTPYLGAWVDPSTAGINDSEKLIILSTTYNHTLSNAN
jgi:hypothetical protein